MIGVTEGMKLDRMLAIVMLLLNRSRVSAKELAERFEVSLRTIYRDVEAINMAGIPIVSYAGANGGYEVADRYRLDRQTLSLEELESIIVALRGMQATLDDGRIGGLLDKVGALLAKSERERSGGASQELLIDINPWRTGRAEKSTLLPLREAVAECRVVTFSYTDGEGVRSRRVCEPMAVVMKGFGWYLYAYCRKRMDFRIFRLTRISGLEVLEETFQRREARLEELDSRWIAAKPAAPPLKVKLLFRPSVLARVLDHFEPEEIREQPDGSLLVETESLDDAWLPARLLAYGAAVTVLEPDRLRRELRDEALAVAALYAD